MKVKIVTVEYQKVDDAADGYGYDGCYTNQHYHSDFGSEYPFRNIYFLHDLYEDILERSPILIDLLIERTKSVKMYSYIQSYINHKIKQDEKMIN